MESITDIRVRYAETDAMGIVHHSHFVVWMELGRSDLLRRLGRSYADWEAQGVRLPVNGVSLTYRSPARYDELVQVRTSLKEMSRRHVAFAYRIERDGLLLAEGESRHLVAGADGRATVLPEALRAMLSAEP
ncbi:MAG TPA: thioesterase family protein [Holophagaceae bacterium]|jgi:acyl-CoA thioester hydrolase|nr:thioesterase family protein [Holophagaceae bacterium]